MPRTNRRSDELRPLTFERGYTGQAPGSVLVRSGRTTVLCTCCVDKAVPEWLVGRGQGWLTAEYGMLPGSTAGRKPRDKGGKVDGRSVEIQRLIGRSMRAVVDLIVIPWPYVIANYVKKHWRSMEMSSHRPHKSGKENSP